MITSRQIELVENSWNYVLHNSHEIGTVFYKRLFEIDPGLTSFFKGDIKTQSLKLLSIITFAVHKLDKLEEIMALLGIQHKKYSVKPEHYETVASALIWALENTSGKEWNEDVKDAWIAVYNVLSKTMIGATQNLPGII